MLLKMSFDGTKSELTRYHSATLENDIGSQETQHNINQTGGLKNMFAFT